MTDRATEQPRPQTPWLYQGIWRPLVNWFNVPREAPTIPFVAAPRPGEPSESPPVQQLHPDPAYLRYLKLWWRIAFGVIGALLAIGCITLLIVETTIGVIVTIAAVLLLTIPYLIAWITLHLRYDTTWYVLTDRSLRLRRGVWTIHELTVTFENVQNVRTTQGPVERIFGIKRLLIETAGGGGSSMEEGPTNHCVLEGLTNAEQIRDLIMTRVRLSRSAGLGDSHQDRGDPARPAAALSPRHLEALRALRDQANALARAAEAR